MNLYYQKNEQEQLLSQQWCSSIVKMQEDIERRMYGRIHSLLRERYVGKLISCHCYDTIDKRVYILVKQKVLDIRFVSSNNKTILTVVIMAKDELSREPERERRRSFCLIFDEPIKIE